MVRPLSSSSVPGCDSTSAFTAARATIELRVHEARALHGAGGLAPLDAVQSRRRQSQRREQRIESADAAAAHQRHRAAQTFCHFAQQGS